MILWNKDTLVQRHYITFWELVTTLQYYTDVRPHIDKVTDGVDNVIGLSEIINIYLNPETFDTLAIDDEYSRAMFSNYLWPQFQQSCVAIIDNTDPEEPTVAEIRNWTYEHMQLWWRWLRESKERYEPLIQNLETIKSKLLDRIGSQSVTLFNDTPQNGGDFVQDPYTTNATKSTTESDVATPIARLKEVQDLLRNYYSDWANEFSRFVIYSAEGNDDDF